tara:strand:- start:23 stop:1066 length:1044 start_codon:yes stop_codon:yes gene_type:complete
MGSSPIARVSLEATPPLSSSQDSTALSLLTDFVKSDLAAVNAVLLQEMQSEIDLIPQLAHHLISSGGKRIRPLLTLASAKLCGYNGTKHIDLAACVEFIHTATLLHDDVVDESKMRRGKASANALWGNQASVLVGDFLFSRAFQLMVRVGHLETLGVLANASATIAEGEVMQLMDNNNLDIVEQRYFDIVKAKTAALFEAACLVGGMISQSNASLSKALGTYGSAFGVCFQIIDDVLDYAADEQELGKSIGDDFREGKVTLPVIYAYHKGSAEERQFWERVFTTAFLDKSDLTQAQAYLFKHNALDYARDKAAFFGAQAKSALTVFEDSELKTALASLVDFCLGRGY